MKRGVSTDCGYAEYFVGRAGFVTPLPDGLDPVAGAPLMCAGITAFNGLTQNVVAITMILLLGSAWTTEYIGIRSLFGAFMFGAVGSLLAAWGAGGGAGVSFTTSSA